MMIINATAEIMAKLLDSSAKKYGCRIKFIDGWITYFGPPENKLAIIEQALEDLKCTADAKKIALSVKDASLNSATTTPDCVS